MKQKQIQHLLQLLHALTALVTTEWLLKGGSQIFARVVIFANSSFKHFDAYL